MLVTPWESQQSKPHNLDSYGMTNVIDVFLIVVKER